MVLSFFKSTVERRITVASRKENLDAILVGWALEGSAAAEVSAIVRIEWENCFDGGGCREGKSGFVRRGVSKLTLRMWLRAVVYVVGADEKEEGE